MPAGFSTPSDSTTSSPAARRAPTSRRGHTRWRTASAGEASPSTRSAAPSSSRRSSTSATIHATRSRSRLQTHLHEPLLRDLWQLLSSLAGGRGRRWRSCSWGASACVCGASRRVCPTRTTPTRPIWYRARSRMFEHGLNPHYFANPPAYTYLLHYLFALAYGGKTGVQHAFALHPDHLYTLARAGAAVLGAAALWLLVCDRCAPCLAAASACSRRPSRRSRFYPSSTPTSRSTTCPRWRRSRCRCWGPPVYYLRAAGATICWRASAWALPARASTRPGS